MRLPPHALPPAPVIAVLRNVSTACAELRQPLLRLLGASGARPGRARRRRQQQTCQLGSLRPVPELL
eukprot:6679421-Pyramimonas_sp.AAC.1